MDAISGSGNHSRVMTGAVAAAMTLGLAASTASAAQLFWDPDEGGAGGDFYDAAYFNEQDPSQNPDTPESGTDEVVIAGDAEVDLTSTSSNGTSTGMFTGPVVRVGSGFGPENTAGTGTLNINGASLTATATGSHAAFSELTGGASMIVGQGRSATLNIDSGTLATTERLRLGFGFPAPEGDPERTGVLNVSDAGATTAAATVNVGTGLLLGSGPNGTVNLSDDADDGDNASINVTNDFVVGADPNGDGTGTLNMSGGALTIDNRFRVGFGSAGEATLSGGTINAGVAESGPTITAVGDGSAGTLAISGGTLNAVSELAVGNAGSGTLSVTGSDAAINVTGAYNQSADGTLDATLASDGSLTEIQVTGDATFADGSTLSFDSDGFTLSGDQAFDVLTAGEVIDNGLTFNGPSGYFTRVVDGGNGEILQVTNVPEPTSLALMGLGGFALLRRRKRG